MTNSTPNIHNKIRKGGIYTNGLIIGTVLGMLCLGIRGAQQAAFGEVVFSLKRDLPFLFSAMTQLKSITTPFALLVLGGQFTFSAVRGMAREIAIGTLWRIVIAPALGIGVAIALTNLLDFGVNEYPALIALFGSPTAVSSAIMAGQMGSDEQLATQLVVWPSLLSIITIFHHRLRDDVHRASGGIKMHQGGTKRYRPDAFKERIGNISRRRSGAPESCPPAVCGSRHRCIFCTGQRASLPFPHHRTPSSSRSTCCNAAPGG